MQEVSQQAPLGRTGSIRKQQFSIDTDQILRDDIDHQETKATTEQYSHNPYLDEIEDIRAHRLPNTKDMEVCETRKVIILGDTGKFFSIVLLASLKLVLLPIIPSSLFPLATLSTVLTAFLFASALPRSGQIVHSEQTDAGPVRHGAQLHDWRGVRLPLRQSGRHTAQAANMGHGRPGVLPIRNQNLLQSRTRRVSLLLHYKQRNLQ